MTTVFDRLFGQDPADASGSGGQSQEIPDDGLTFGEHVQLLQRLEGERRAQLGALGRVKETLFGRQPEPTAFSAQQEREMGPVPGEVTTIEVPAAHREHRSTSTMTRQQLRTRRMNVIEGAKFGRPFHEAAMLFVLRGWLLLGPLAFVALTTSEVAYILTHLVAPGDRYGTLVIWGGALFIDLAMMFTTFGVAIKRRDLADKRDANGGVLSKREEAEVWIGTAMWLTFAVINIISQAAFLLHIILVSHDGNLTLLYLFVGSRVIGFILGDASTAFFLAKVDSSHLKLIARAEREKGTLYADIAKAEGERQLTEAKAEADILLIQLKVRQEEEDANFLADLKRHMFSDILSRRGLPPGGTSEVEGPNRSRVRRLDS